MANRHRRSFQKEFGGTIGKGGLPIALFENHYNARLNKCIYLLDVRTIRDDKKKLHSLTLNDLLDNKSIAGYLSLDDEVIFCSMRDTHCRTADEWRALIKPFMEE